MFCYDVEFSDGAGEVPLEYAVASLLEDSDCLLLSGSAEEVSFVFWQSSPLDLRLFAEPFSEVVEFSPADSLWWSTLHDDFEDGGGVEWEDFFDTVRFGASSDGEGLSCATSFPSDHGTCKDGYSLDSVSVGVFLYPPGVDLNCVADTKVRNFLFQIRSLNRFEFFLYHCLSPFEEGQVFSRRFF